MKKNKDIEYSVTFKQTLKRNPYKGLFVAFEGIDGAGKSVQAKYLDKYLKSIGKNTLVVFQPTRNGPVGGLINDILQKKVKVPSASLQYLYTADRIIDHFERIGPALNKGKIVISHRCMWSNLPYGLLDKGVIDYDSNSARTIQVAHGLFSLYNQFIIPDITFYLRVSTIEAIRRLERMHRVLETIYEKKIKMEKVAEEVRKYIDKALR